MLNLFTVFHLNLMYSSIEVAERPKVIRQAYTPLLDMIEHDGLRLGLELPALTLELIAELDPEWVRRLGALWAAGRCEVVGAGYTQMIGPLWPSALNLKNYTYGMDVYERLLGKRPELVLFNEQAYSSALLPACAAAGFKGVIMEWDNPASLHPTWRNEWRYHPHYVQHGHVRLPLLWNASICFQKVQRYVHEEIAQAELLDYLVQHQAPAERFLCLYGGDAEVFDYRPGRYQNEAVLQGGEWRRMAEGFKAACALPDTRMVLPSEVLGDLSHPMAGQNLRLETAACPVPVKKQEKYNINRWAVTGRNDLDANTRCLRIFHALEKKGLPCAADQWRELLFLCSSDFRTHCRPARWADFENRLAALETALGLPAKRENLITAPASGPRLSVRQEHRFLIAEQAGARLVLNCHRGLAVQSCHYDAVSPRSLFGTVDHGYFSRIDLSADFYTGNVVAELPARPKVTDLGRVAPEIGSDAECPLVVTGQIETPLGPVRKQLRWQPDERWLETRYDIQWTEPFMGSLRLGHLLLNPAAYDRDTLFHNMHGHDGGPAALRLAGQGNFDHGRAINPLISAAHGFGLPEGKTCLGDDSIRINVTVDTDLALPLGQIAYYETGTETFTRLCFSLSEMDETRLLGPQARPGGWQFAVRYHVVN